MAWPVAAGPVLAWGANGLGELGDGTLRAPPVPEVVRGLGGLASISSFGGHSVAVAADGSAVAWGDNARGEVGDGSTAARRVPTPVIRGCGMWRRWLPARIIRWR